MKGVWGGGGIYPPAVVVWVRGRAGGDIGAGVKNRFYGRFWRVCTFFGGGWYGYTGKSVLPLYGR